MNATEKYNHITTFQIALVKMNKMDTHINGIQNGWFNIKVKWDEYYLAFIWYWRCFDSSYKVVYSGRCRLIQVNDGGTPQTGSRKARHGAPSCPAPGQSCRQHGFVPANVCDNYTEYCLPGKLTQPSISGVFVESGSHRRGPSFSGLTLLCSPSRGPADTR